MQFEISCFILQNWFILSFLLQDILSLKASRENLEAENSQLRAQLFELENLKLALASQYEETIKKIRDGHEIEKSQLKQELSQYLEGKKSGLRPSENVSGTERKSQATQTVEVEPSKIQELRSTLRLLSDQCLALDNNLETVQEAIEDVKEKEALITNEVSGYFHIFFYDDEVCV